LYEHSARPSSKNAWFAAADSAKKQQNENAAVAFSRQDVLYYRLSMLLTGAGLASCPLKVDFSGDLLYGFWY
jgi:hypothetical protein